MKTPAQVLYEELLPRASRGAWPWESLDDEEKAVWQKAWRLAKKVEPQQTIIIKMPSSDSTMEKAAFLMPAGIDIHFDYGFKNKEETS